MKIERTKNAANNLIWGIIERIVGLVIPFVCRAAMIRYFGIHYLGLNSLFTSVLSMLNIAELGFGSAVVYFLYRAIAEEDTSKICALMHYIKRVYRSVGIVVLCLGVALMPFIQYMIKSDVPSDVNIYVIYLLTLAASVLSYFFSAYKEAIFRSHQKIDVLSKISSIIMVIEKFLQLFAVFVCRSYYLYISSMIIVAILRNILLHFAAQKRYPQYVASGTLAREEKQAIYTKIRGLLMYKIGNVINGMADSIVVSAFLGLAIMGKYGNYYYVITTLIGFLGVFFTSIRAGIGNSIVTECVEKNYGDFKMLQFAQNWVIGWCTVCLFSLFQDFIAIYAGVQNQLPFGYVVCLCIYFWSWKIQDVIYVYKEAAGMWMQDRYRPIIGALVNLCLNLTMVQFIGLYGVILSSVFVFVFIDIPWAPQVLFKKYFGFECGSYYRMLWTGFWQTLCMLLPTYFLCSWISLNSLIFQLFLKAIICLVVPNMIYIGLNYQKIEFSALMKKTGRIFRTKISKE